MLLLAAVIGGVFLAKREDAPDPGEIESPYAARGAATEPQPGDAGDRRDRPGCRGGTGGEAMSHSLDAYLSCPALLFAIGSFGFLARRNAIAMLMSIELMLNAVNLAIVAFGAFTPALAAHAAVIALFVMAVAAAEATVGPGHRHRHLPQPPHAAGRRVLEHARVARQ